MGKVCIVLLAYMMLIDPVCLQQLAQGATQYSELDARQWNEGNRTIVYSYDNNGSVISKVTTATNNPSVELERVEYEYNLQNKLASVTTTPYVGGQPQTPLKSQGRNYGFN